MGLIETRLFQQTQIIASCAFHAEYRRKPFD